MSESTPRRLPEKAADTTAENPWPVRTLSRKMGEYIDRMSALWVEGQVVQLSRRGDSPRVYLTLRDTDVDMSLSVSVPTGAVLAMGSPLTEGARVVVNLKPSFWEKRGTLTMDARQIRPVGVGELLARLEHLKQVLHSEGLFAPERKRPLPFVPTRVGLICGRGSAAERDVVQNAQRRWPSVEFVIHQVAVQGPDAVPQVMRALAELQATDGVDVIVIARGGGSVEDLLPFSNEALVRAAAQCRVPVVSAIGHEVDTPLLDFVADLRASTPTDAAKRIVPDVHEEHAGLHGAVSRGRRALAQRHAHERQRIEALMTRPVMADPATLVTRERDLLDHARARGAQALQGRLHRAADQVEHLRAQVRGLSPQSTLERGYAVVRDASGHVVTSPAQVEAGQAIRVQVAGGEISARVTAAAAGDPTRDIPQSDMPTNDIPTD